LLKYRSEESSKKGEKPGSVGLLLSDWLFERLLPCGYSKHNDGCLRGKWFGLVELRLKSRNSAGLCYLWIRQRGIQNILSMGIK